MSFFRLHAAKQANKKYGSQRVTTRFTYLLNNFNLTKSEKKNVIKFFSSNYGKIAVFSGIGITTSNLFIGIPYRMYVDYLYRGNGYSEGSPILQRSIFSTIILGAFHGSASVVKGFMGGYLWPIVVTNFLYKSYRYSTGSAIKELIIPMYFSGKMWEQNILDNKENMILPRKHIYEPRHRYFIDFMEKW